MEDVYSIDKQMKSVDLSDLCFGKIEDVGSAILLH
jgi:hypothetical protein